MLRTVACHRRSLENWRSNLRLNSRFSGPPPGEPKGRETDRRSHQSVERRPDDCRQIERPSPSDRIRDIGATDEKRAGGETPQRETPTRERCELASSFGEHDDGREQGSARGAGQSAIQRHTSHDSQEAIGSRRKESAEHSVDRQSRQSDRREDHCPDAGRDGDATHSSKKGHEEHLQFAFERQA